MDIESTLQQRSESKCELCSSEVKLGVYQVADSPSSDVDASIYICSTCHEQIETPDLIDINHWRCLNDSMWNPTPAVQVVAWRMLNRIKNEDWPADLLGMLYLDDDTLTWAQAGDNQADDSVKHVDSNGAVLQAGDSVTLIKDLDVKGANFTAKRGTAVRGISLVADNAEHIEGRVEGQRIIILTKFVKKQIS